MSSYLNLGATGQEYIQEEEYKALFGYPNGKVNLALSAEVPGTSRPFLLQNQIYSQTIPTTAPTIPGNFSTKTVNGIDVSYNAASSPYNYLTYYNNVTLSNADLAQDASGNGLTWWFLGANISNAGTLANQVSGNILNQAVPSNLDPAGEYTPILKINGTQHNFGNSQYPWTFNVNSGIILFTGSPASPSITTNIVPSSTATITLSFWRYEGTFGIPTSPWDTSGNNIYYNTGSVAIGTSTFASGYAFDVSGNSYFNGNIDISGNAGINNPNPQAALDVYGNERIVLPTYTPTNDNNILFTLSDLSNNSINRLNFGLSMDQGGWNGITKAGDNIIYWDNSSNLVANATNGLCIGPHLNGISSGIRIDISGVSINTNSVYSNPGYALDVSGNIRINSSNTMLSIQNNGATKFTFSETPGVLPAFTFTAGNGGQILATAPGANILINSNYGAPSNGNIYIFTDTSSNMTKGITVCGVANLVNNIGINNSSPQYTLDVSGNINFTGNITKGGQPISGLTQWSNGSNNAIFYNSGNVGIGTSTPQYTLDVSGNIHSNATTTSASFNATSDYRIKENVVELDETYSVDNLRPVKYTNKLTGKEDLGLIAHELQEIYPFLVNGKKDDETQKQSINYQGLIAVLINEIKELKNILRKNNLY